MIKYYKLTLDCEILRGRSQKVNKSLEVEEEGPFPEVRR